MMVRLFIPVKVPSPKPMKDLAISIATENPATGFLNAGRSQHSSRRPHKMAHPLQGEFFFVEGY
jgi:hypothetical protein